MSVTAALARRLRRAAAGAALAAVAAHAGPLLVPGGPRGAAAGEPGLVAAHDWPDDVPPRLSATGLYRADGTVDPRNRPFAPQYPLWTDGARKTRWVRLPEGATIDVSDLDAWRFPRGTTVWKEFAWGGRKVETRMIRFGEDGRWRFAAYVWDEDQRDATLAPAAGVAGAHEVAPGRFHAVPGRADCVACHGSAPSALLGFSALQLSDDRDPLAPHAEPLPAGAVTLRTLVSEGRLAPPRPDLVQRPPRIRASDPVERAALGYLSGNCGGCHNARGPLGRLGFALLHDAGAPAGAPEPARVTTVGAPSRFALPGAAPESARVVVAGAPERSVLAYRMRSRRPSSQMPPLGTALADTQAVALVTRWIAGLAPDAGERVAADPR